MSSFVTEAFTLLALAVVIIVFRTYARWVTVGPKNFQLDDYLMPLAAVVFGLETGAAYCVGAWFHGLANNAMTPEQRVSLQPGSPEYAMRVGGSKTQVLGWSLYTLLLWLLKCCMAIFYRRLTAGLVNMQLRVRIAYFLIGATYIATICSILFGCFPLQKNWQVYPDPGNHCQPAVSKIDIYVTVILNVATDIYLMTIPAPARLRWREKLELAILFSGGLFVMMAGILRCVLILTAGKNGAEQAGSWACRETFVAVVIGNVPMIYPVLRRWFFRAGEVITTRKAGSYGTNGAETHEFPMSPEASHRSQARRKKYRHPLSLPGDTQFYDEQAMLPATQFHTLTETTAEHELHDKAYSSSSEGIRVTHETIIHNDKAASQ